jgi:N-acetylneuraminic acid mutarotase
LKSIEVNSSKGSKGWSYSSTSQKLGTKILPSSAYYPPSCSGYDMAYCKYTDTLYIYGGIACSSSLQDGIKQYFYKLSERKWSEVKPESTYHPSPRYGHTFTSYNRDVILFGGVS